MIWTAKEVEIYPPIIIMKSRERTSSKRSHRRDGSITRKSLERTCSDTSITSDKLYGIHINSEQELRALVEKNAEDEVFSDEIGVHEDRQLSWLTSSSSDQEGQNKYDLNIGNVMFSHPVYEKASQVLAYLKGDLTSSQLPLFKSDLEKRRVYSLAFATHRYKDVLEDVLVDSCFYSMYLKFEGTYNNHIQVMLLDYYNHGYRFSGNKRKILVEDNITHIPYIYEMQTALLNSKVRLCSSFARSRIRACALNLEGLLSETAQERSQLASSQLLYARMTNEKLDQENILNTLQGDGFVLSEKQNVTDLCSREFQRDKHFSELLVFSSECKDEVYSHMLVHCGILIPQDKAKYIITEVAKACFLEAAMQRDKANHLISADTNPLVQDQEDIIITSPESAAVISQLASVMEPDRKIFICGCSKLRKFELSRQLAKLPIESVHIELLEDNFLALNHNEERFRKVKLIVCNVPCSKSGIVNLEDFILQESSEYAKHLVSEIDAGRLTSIAKEEQLILRHCFKFSQVQYAIYFTNSVRQEENEALVMKTMREYLMETTSKNPFEMNPFLPDLVANLRTHINSLAKEKHAKNLCSTEDCKYLRVPASSCMNGFFIAYFKRKYLESTAQEMMERAAKNAAGKTGKGSKKKKKGNKKGTKGNAEKGGSVEEEENAFLSVPGIRRGLNGTESPTTCDSGIVLDFIKEESGNYENHSRKTAKSTTKKKKKKKIRTSTAEPGHKH